ncbi:helix-turn-helix domain-containing protein [Sinobacterium norvegicum]|nr:helix-turn-helix domain-containing protein [Sinobacterium norvegicum]
MAAPLWRLFWYPKEGITLRFDNGETISIRKGSLYLIPAGVNFSGSQSEPLDEFHILFNFNPGLFSLRKNIYAFGVDDELLALVGQLQHHSNQHSPLLTLKAMSILNRCLSSIDEDHWQVEQVEPKLWPVLQRMRQSGRDKASNQHLADTIGMSESAFIRLFTKELGLAPQQYLATLRINRSKEMLIGDGGSIEKIAEACGFCDKSHFSRQFKKQTGLSPSQYRQRLSSNHGQRGGE